MADWWDADGQRHRKQFSTSAAAREHEHRETALAHAERASREMKLARYLTKRIESAEVVDPCQQTNRGQVFFGATVEYRRGNDAKQKVAITGIDELIERLEREEFDLVAVGRSLIVNPAWPAVIRRGAIEELKPFQRDVLAELV